MTIPRADSAEIADEKLRDYLLNLAHRRGGSKAVVLMSMGYSAEEFQRLGVDLKAQHLSLDCTSESDSDYGKRYEIADPLTGPNGRTVRIVSVWQIDEGQDYPRLITLYPEKP